MKIYSLGKYADEGVLSDPDTAAFLHLKLEKGEVLDFAGITSVTPEFLHDLLDGLKPEALVECFVGLPDSVAAQLSAWLEGKPEDPSPKAKTKSKQPSKHSPNPAPPVPVFAPAVVQGERYTPTRLANQLHMRLQSYIESAYPLSDTTLIKARRKLLEEHGGRLLAQEPFVETTPRYKIYPGTFADLDIPKDVAGLLQRATTITQDYDPNKSLLYKEMYEHQAQAFTATLGAGKDLVVATGTGSGKTECFMVPMLGRLYQEAKKHPATFERRAVRALILYPMNALVNDQTARLRLLLGSETLAAEFRGVGPGGRHPVFGMYTGRTPYPGSRDHKRDVSDVEPMLEAYLDLDDKLAGELKRMGRYPAKDLAAFLGTEKIGEKVIKSGKKKGQTKPDRNWDERLLTGKNDRELLTRQEMVRDPASEQGNAPDVLVTNYSMLEYMLMRPFERPIFDQTRAWLREPGSQFLLVLDEAHMYRGAKGAEVAFLIRRLLSRLEIIDKPEKLSVICTSASLGDGNTRLVAQRFAADLTGKGPDSFEIVFGEREKPSPVAPGEADLAELLAAVPSESLHDDIDRDKLIAVLQPLFAHLGSSEPFPAPSELPARLYSLLSKRPWVNKLLEQTAGHALPLQKLAEALFPGSPVARQATETLLALGTLAKAKSGESSLLPTRIHMMFRGLNGVYACVNPTCSGRQVSPGEKAPLGRLFASPRALCDACGSRVLEVASCRSCGVAYLLGYVPSEQLQFAKFIWGEGEGDLEKLQILPTPPRNYAAVEEVLFQLKTGLLAEPGQGAAGETRPVWIARNRDEGKREFEFKRCPVCLPEGSKRKSQLLDLRTKGEQPFTALIEAQFAEQPPQSSQPGLPNQGRKVLVFSDGRQKAARLAPALETSHSADAFRQVLLLAAEKLKSGGRPPNLGWLYSSLLVVCHERRIDLFPAKDETEFHSHLTMAADLPVETLRNYTQPPLAFAQKLYEELTDRYFSLQAMGMASIEEDPIFSYIFQDFPSVGMDPDEIRALTRAWIRIQLERRSFLPGGASRGQLGEQFERPEGITLEKDGDLVPPRLAEFITEVLGASALAPITAWFRQLGSKGKLLLKMDNEYFLKPEALILNPRMDAPWYRCTQCSRLELNALRGRCYECRGDLVSAFADPLYLEAKYGYYRDQVVRALGGKSLEPFGLTTAEHSAQLTAMNSGENYTKTETYELRFQDIRVENEPPIDVLSCTTTMEVGIDIGALTGVALRNIPPHVANYQQRAGRAGRRGKTIASVITYAHGGSHDAWFYDHPEAIISGAVKAPEVYTDNLTVLRRHANAYLVQRFFHSEVGADSVRSSLFESMGKVSHFLDPSQPCSLFALRAWLEKHRSLVEAELRAWIPATCHSSSSPVLVEELVPGVIDSLLVRLESELPIELLARKDQLGEREKEALTMQLEERLLETLISKAIFPRYAFPLDTVSFWVPRARKQARNMFQREFDYSPQRDLQIALTEYAPGRTLTIDKLRFEGAALYSPYQAEVKETLEKARDYTACKTCGFVSLKAEDQNLAACPICTNPDLFRQKFVRPAGFAPDINATRQFDRGGMLSYAGMSTPARMEVQNITHWDAMLYSERVRLRADQFDLVVVNKGVRDRGFMICPSCGRAEPVFGQGYTTPKLFSAAGQPRIHEHPTERGQQCQATGAGPYFLGHQFRTDVLLLRLKFAPPMRCSVGDLPGIAGSPGYSGAPARIALTSVVEALCLAASRELQIDEGEMAGNWTPVMNSTEESDLYLYDLLPGGAGYTHQVRQNLAAILAKSRELVRNCDCDTSCHRCLRHYGNQFIHRSLNRHLALALLDYVLDGSVPTLTSKQGERSLEPLSALLDLRGIAHAKGAAPVPLKVTLNKVETLVAVHHPLVDPEVASASAMKHAEATLSPVVSLDWYELLYDLQASFQRLQAHARS